MSTDKVNEFIQHCVKLNFPPEAIPDSDYLKKIFQSRHCPLLENFVERVKHKNEIKNLRDNLLVASVNSGQLQKQLNFIKIRQLKSKLQEIQQKHDAVRQKEENFLQVLRERELNLTQVKHDNDTRKVTIAVLEAKLEQTQRKLKEQKEVEQRIAKSMPVVVASHDDSNTFSICKEKLANFYLSPHADEEHESATTQKAIESSLRTLANSSIFENFMKAIQAHQKQIEGLEDSQRHIKDGNLFASLTMQLITQLNYELACRGIKTIELKKQIAVAKERCNESVENFSKRVIACFSQYEDIDFMMEEEEDLNEYLEEFLSAVIANYKAQGANKRAKQLLDELNTQVNGHSKVDQFATVRQQDDDIMNLTSGELTKFESKHAQLHKILEKINLLKLSTRQKIYTIQSENQMNELSRTMVGVKIDDEKMEFNYNEKELNAFRNIPINQLKLPSLHTNLTDSLPTATVELMRKTNCDTSSINKFLQSLLKLLETHQNFTAIAQTREPNIKIVDEPNSSEHIREQIELHRDEISEQIDTITSVNDDIRLQLEFLEKLHDHMLTNPLAAYVPATKTLEGKTYAEYEKEIKMYVRAIKN